MKFTWNKKYTITAQSNNLLTFNSYDGPEKGRGFF